MPVIKERLLLWANQQIIPTLRGLFYTLVSLNILENTPARYDYLSNFTAKARERSEKRLKKLDRKTGKAIIYSEEETLPIDCFADNVRQIIDIDDDYYTSKEFVAAGIDYYTDFNNYKVPRWYKQAHYVEVWVEKDALASTLNSIINIAGKRQVRIVPTRGQESVTFAWENVERLRQKEREGKKVHIRYFGDLDPSGEQIEKSIREKLFEEPYRMYGTDFKRVGVTNEQRIKFRLIPNTDPKTMNKLKKDTTRFAFMEKYGLQSENELFQIEVDALEAIAPTEFKAMVLESVDEFFDEDIYQANLADPEITLKMEDFNEIAINETKNLLVSLQNFKDNSESDEF